MAEPRETEALRFGPKRRLRQFVHGRHREPLAQFCTDLVGELLAKPSVTSSAASTWRASISD